MLDNIRAHSIMVARVARVLLRGLADSTIAEEIAIPPDDLVLAGALLHDIAKTPCLASHHDHAKQGRDICLERGYPEIAEIVREHVLLREFCTLRYAKGHFLAKELVYYADKRVRHDEIVSIEERLEYILERYGHNDPGRFKLIRENFRLCRTLEEHLLSALGMTADDTRLAALKEPIPA